MTLIIISYYILGILVAVLGSILIKKFNPHEVELFAIIAFWPGTVLVYMVRQFRSLLINFNKMMYEDQ